MSAVEATPVSRAAIVAPGVRSRATVMSAVVALSCGGLLAGPMSIAPLPLVVTRSSAAASVVAAGCGPAGAESPPPHIDGAHVRRGHWSVASAEVVVSQSRMVTLSRMGGLQGP